MLKVLSVGGEKPVDSYEQREASNGDGLKCEPRPLDPAELVAVSGGVWVAYTDDGRTVTP